MAVKLFICITIAVTLIQPFNTLPAAEPQQGEYYYVSDDSPLYWRHKNTVSPSKEHVVIVEPTITYTRQAEYSNQPVSSGNFKPSPNEKESDFKPYDGQGRSDSQIAYYPYYFREASSDRNEAEERRRIEQSNRVSVDVGDPAYQRFVPRNTDSNQRWYYTDGRPVPQEPTVSSKSSVRFYFPNGTAIRTYYNEDNQQVMDIHPNQYIIKVTEKPTTTTTTSRPSTTSQSPIYWRSDVDCPPFSPCNTVVYQQSTQCCKCYLVPNRCCACNYSNRINK